MNTGKKPAKKSNQARPRRAKRKRSETDASPTSKKIVRKDDSPSTKLANNLLDLSLASPPTIAPPQPTTATEQLNNPTNPTEVFVPATPQLLAPIAEEIDTSDTDEKERVGPSSDMIDAAHVKVTVPPPPKPNRQPLGKTIFIRPRPAARPISNALLQPPAGPRTIASHPAMPDEPPLWHCLSQTPIRGPERLMRAMPGCPNADFHVMDPQGRVYVRCWNTRSGAQETFSPGISARLWRIVDCDLEENYYITSPHNKFVTQCFCRDDNSVAPLSSRAIHFDKTASESIAAVKDVYEVYNDEGEANYFMGSRVDLAFNKDASKREINKALTILNGKTEVFTAERTSLMMWMLSQLTVKFLVIVTPPGATNDDAIKFSIPTKAVCQIAACPQTNVTVVIMTCEKDGLMRGKGGIFMAMQRKRQLPIGQEEDDSDMWES